MKITLAIPSNRGVRTKTVKSLLDLVAKGGYEFHVIIAEYGYTIAENRNYLSSQAFKNDSEYILMVDDDMVFPNDTLDRLIGHKKDIIGVASNQRKLPIQTTVEPLGGGEIPDKVFEVKAVGGGVLLIDMVVFKKMPQPWFSFKTHSNGMTMVGEDKWFCDKARGVGFSVWCDPTIIIKHLGEYEY